MLTGCQFIDEDSILCVYVLREANQVVDKQIGYGTKSVNSFYVFEIASYFICNTLRTCDVYILT